MPQNQTLSLETITKAKYSENKRFFISLFLLFSYWQSPHNSIWVMLCWQRMLTGKQWQHQSSSVPTCRSENPLMLPGSPCTLHGLNNLNTAQGRSVPPRKLLQRSVCWNWVPPFPRHPCLSETWSYSPALPWHAIQPSDSFADNCFTFLPHLELLVSTSPCPSAHTEGRWQQEWTSSSPASGNPTHHCWERALTASDRTGHTSLHPGMGPHQWLSVC